MHNKTDRQRLGGFGSNDQGNLNKLPMAFISIKKKTWVLNVNPKHQWQKYEKNVL